MKKIRLLILDVDGVLTDGRIFFHPGTGWTRQFHMRDGYGIKMLMQAGVQVAVISGSDTDDIRARMETLKIAQVYLGDENKLKALEQLSLKNQIAPDCMAFIGDELFDIPVLEKVGFSATVPDAVDAVKSRVHYVTKAAGGWGAVREITDAIRQAQGLGPYLT